MAKDAWDKLNIVVSNIILVAIPIVIGVVGDNISRSLERGKFVDSLLDDLTTPTAKTRRDIALVALDSAIPPSKDESQPDQVVDIAGILLKDTIVGVKEPQELIQRKIESSVAKKIINKRKPHEAEKLIPVIIAEALETLPNEQKNYNIATAQTTGINTAQAPNLANAQKNEQKELNNENIKRKQTAEIINSLLTSDVKIVYIQYKQDRQVAEAVQNYLKEQGIVAPGIQKISTIKQDDIRFSSESEKKIAQQLKSKIEDFLKTQNITKNFELINLSKPGYKVPLGQFEIWINQ